MLISSRNFQEALKVTAKVKATFIKSVSDLRGRADRLIRTSLQAGVTFMRAHVEVDKTVNEVCLEVGLQLKSKWSKFCSIQISRKSYLLSLYVT